MPLNRESTKSTNVAGYIRTGTKNDKGYPVDTGRKFVLTPKDPQVQGAPSVAAVYGDQPEQLKVVIPFDDIDRVIDAWYKLWGADSGSLCVGNRRQVMKLWAPLAFIVDEHKGRTRVRQDPNGEHYKAVENGVVINPYREINGDLYDLGEFPSACGGPKAMLYPRCGACKANIRVNLFVRHPHATRSFRGVDLPFVPVDDEWLIYTLLTGSEIGYDRMLGELEDVREKYGVSYGALPFILTRESASIQTLMGGRVGTTEKFVPTLRLDKEAFDLMAKAGIFEPQSVFSAPSAKGALPAPIKEDVEEEILYLDDVTVIEEAEYAEESELFWEATGFDTNSFYQLWQERGLSAAEVRRTLGVKGYDLTTANITHPKDVAMSLEQAAQEKQ